MDSISSYINSGILEAYVLGIASPAESVEVEQMAAAHPEVKEELAQIAISLEHYASDQAVEPHATMKPLLFATIDYMQRLQGGEPAAVPPLLHAGSTIVDYAQWLNRPDMTLPADSEDIFLKILGHTPQATTAIVWIKQLAPDEVHHNEHESFLILEGTCEITIGGKVHNLVPGDYLSIPLHTDHHVKVTSAVPCKVILERKAA